MAAMNIQRNARVLASDGEVGRVTHVVVDPQTKEVTNLVVDGNSGEQMIPIGQVASVDGDRVTLSSSRTQLQGMAFQRDQYHPIDEDAVRTETTRTAQHGGTPLQDAAQDAVQVGGQQQTSTTRRQTQGEQPYHLQLREEHLRVGTVQEQAGEVTLGTRVVEHEESVTVPLREERVVIERAAGSGQPVGGAITDSDQTIEVDLMRERAVAQKDAVVSEEVHVRKEVTERQERVSDTVRREELVVDGNQEAILPTKDGQPVHDHTHAGGSERS